MIEPVTLGLWCSFVVLTVSCLLNCANSNCLMDKDFKYSFVVMLFQFQLNPVSKSQLMHNKVELNIPGKASDCKHKN